MPLSVPLSQFVPFRVSGNFARSRLCLLTTEFPCLTINDIA